MFLTPESGLLGILDVRHARTTPSIHRLNCHVTWIHSSRDDPHCLLWVCDLLCCGNFDRQDGEANHKPIFNLNIDSFQGATYAIPYPAIVRTSFGMYGSYPAICLRAFVAAMWTAILCVQAGAFLQNCIEAIWPSFQRFPNHLSENAGITSAGLLCFFIYWIAQTSLALMPIQKLRILFLIKAVIVPPTFLALFLWAVIVTRGGGPLVTGQNKIASTYMDTAYSALTGLNVVIGLFSSMAVNMPDFGRFSKNGLGGYHQYFALPIIGTLGSLTPIFVTSAHSYIWGEFEWYMPAVIAKFDSRAAKFFTGFSFMLATIGNQIAAGTYVRRGPRAPLSTPLDPFLRLMINSHSPMMSPVCAPNISTSSVPPFSSPSSVSSALPGTSSETPLAYSPSYPATLA